MNKPGFLVRYGTLITCLSVIAVGSLAWLVEYPEVVASKAVLMRAGKPEKIVFPSNGYVLRTLKNNGDTVTSGELIGIMIPDTERMQQRSIIAPVSGILSFSGLIQNHQLLRAGEIIAQVDLPENNYYLDAVISQVDIAKVKEGQKVILKFLAYPWQEYGTVSGEVGFISSGGSDSGYHVTIKLPQGLCTNTKIQLPFRQGLIAQLEIITQDMRLIQRLYYDAVKRINK